MDCHLALINTQGSTGFWLVIRRRNLPGKTMTTTATKANNRSLTLAGANKLFSVIDVQIQQDLDYEGIIHYWCMFQGERLERLSLTELCQTLLTVLNSPAL